MRHIVLCLAALMALSPTALSQGPRKPKKAMDLAIGWLRGQQAENGSYGDSVDTTCWVLYGMAKSPRKYRAGDGPFIDRAADFLTSQVNPKLAEAQLSRITATLAALSEKKYQETLTHISAMKPDLAAIDWESDFASSTPEQIIAAQQKNYSWNGSVLDTAKAIVTLATAKKKEKKADVDLASARMKGGEFLLKARDGKLWGFGGKPDAGMTAMATAALLAIPAPRSPEMETAIDDGLAYLASLQKPDGGIYDEGLANYKTSIAVMAMVASGKKEYAKVIKKAQDYIISIQAAEKNGYKPEDRYYGGIGYGSSQRPDLSNTHLALQALHDSNLPSNHEVYKKAITYLTRSQNYSETNTLKAELDGVTYVSGNDGGAGYYPLFSYAGFDTLPNGDQVPRSYGSMSYALLKGYLFAGLPKDDPRLKAVIGWVHKNYTLDENPGFQLGANPLANMQGLFYYYFTLSKGLDTAGIEEIQTPDGKKHLWRDELKAKLLSMQKPDGSWMNEYSGRWWEGIPLVATSYALISLEYVK